MSNFKLRIAVLFLLTLPTIDAQAKPWHGILPLKATRLEVERQLGKANQQGYYQIENERASVFYSDGLCKSSDKCECLVPRDTVRRISVTLDSAVKLSK